MKSLPTETDLAKICLVATDMDGTLTQEGQFSHRLLIALEQLKAAGFPVMIVTGRSAGWVSGLVHYLPIAGAIAENGGLFFSKADEHPIFLQSFDDVSLHRQRLQTQFEQLRQDFPHLQETADNRFRLTDWTFDVTGLSTADLQQMADRCQQEGWGFTYSTVQCHIKLLTQDKAVGLNQILSQRFPTLSATQILTVGDSPNDESLFDASQFPYSVGVANVRHYLDRLQHQPRFITQAEAGEGFCELATMMLSSVAA